MRTWSGLSPLSCERDRREERGLPWRPLLGWTAQGPGLPQPQGRETVIVSGEATKQSPQDYPLPHKPVFDRIPLLRYIYLSLVH